MEEGTMEYKDSAIRMQQMVDEKYNLLVQYHLNDDKQVILSDGETPRRCRFCGERYPDVTFNKVAHALSRMVENRYLKSDYECDVCNGKFANYESDYSAYMNLYHSVFRIEGYGGIPKFKNNSRTFSKIEAAENNVHIIQKEDEEPLIEWSQEDKDNNRINIVGRRTYIPANVYRTIVKMALSVIPKGEMLNFESTLNWLLKKPGTSTDGMAFPVIIRMYRGRLPFTSCLLFKRKNGDQELIPKYLFVLAYANIIIQTWLPFVKADNYLDGLQGDLPFIPCPLDLSQPCIYKEMKMLMNEEKIRGEEVKIPLQYDRIEEKDLRE